MTDRRKPENATMRKHWIKLRAYADLYDVDPRTVLKWAEAGLVTIERVVIAGKRPLLRVKNRPPVEGMTS